MKCRVKKIVVDAVNELNELLDNKVLINDEGDSELYGQGGVLDSISLVTLIVKVEEKIESEFGSPIILANEKAMSQKRSPFLSVNTLSEYIESLISMEVACE